MPEENESQREDQVAARVQEVAERIRRIREPFRQRRRAWSDAILGSLEKRGRERQRGYYNPGPEEEEVEKLKAEVENLKRQLENLHKPPKPRIDIRGE
jgi:predicted CopG family antitoxin